MIRAVTTIFLIAIVFKASCNNRPIIGILTQELSSINSVKYPSYKSYIAASYVKFVEGAGARAVPIWIGKDRSYYEDILSKVNGVLFPGGATFFNKSNGYADAGQHIYKIATEMNNNSIYMPIWGTCLGFELLTYLSANGIEHRRNCNSQKQSLPLKFKRQYKNSSLFGQAPENIISILKTENVTPNFHMYCITEADLLALNLDKQWKILSINHDWNNFKFVSSIEHKNYPFYGVQFHPEKNLYEFILNRNISHTPDAIRAAHYFAEFFVNEARKNNNKFESIEEENNHLIYNYHVQFTGRNGSAFLQIYLFKNADDDVFEISTNP